MKIKCPKCSKVLNVPTELTGKIVKCPCGAKLKTKSQQKISPTNAAKLPERENTSVVINYQFAKNFLQRPIIRYECPACRTKLRSNFNECKQIELCPECGESMHARGSFQRIKSFKESKELQAAHAREQREENPKQQEKERLRVEAPNKKPCSETARKRRIDSN